MPIQRTTMIDDDGSGTTGTILNNAWLQTIYGQIDANPVASAYQPTWASTGTPPALGNGSLTGSYIVLGKFVAFQFSFGFGSTTDPGTGAWYFSLPPLGTPATFVISVELLNSAVGSIPAVGTPYAGAAFAMYAHNAPNGIMGTVPFIWKQYDHIWASGTLIYP